MRPTIGLFLAIAITSLSCSTLPTAPGARVAVTGVIQDRDGNPVSNAYALFRPISSGSRGYVPGDQAITDANGRYRVDLIEGLYEFRIESKGFIQTSFPDVEITKKHPQVDYRFTGYWVRGTLTGPNGTSLPGAEGYVYGRQGGNGGVKVEAGRYSILVPSGSYDFRFDAGYASYGLPTIQLSAVPVSRDTTIDIVLDGNPVTGTILGPGGLPLAGAFVDANSTSASATDYTDVDGHYEVRLPSGAYSIRAAPPQVLSYIATRQVNATVDHPVTLDFDLSGIRWSGTARLASDSSAVPGTRIYAHEQGGGSAASTTTDPAGRFQLIVRPGGVYSVNGYAGDQNLEVIPFTAVAGSDSTFDVYLVPGNPIAIATAREPGVKTSLRTVRGAPAFPVDWRKQP